MKMADLSWNVPCSASGNGYIKKLAWSPDFTSILCVSAEQTKGIHTLNQTLSPVHNFGPGETVSDVSWYPWASSCGMRQLTLFDLII